MVVSTPRSALGVADHHTALVLPSCSSSELYSKAPTSGGAIQLDCCGEQHTQECALAQLVNDTSTFEDCTFPPWTLYMVACNGQPVGSRCLSWPSGPPGCCHKQSAGAGWL
jgi:hypothetical protein